MTADDHWSRIDERAFEVVRLVVDTLQREGVEYVLAGGWAVFAYGSNVPSVDTDAFIASRDGDRAVKALTAQGLEVRPGGRVEPLALDSPNYILGPDSDMGDPDLAYVPRDLFADNTQVRDLPLPGEPVPATVPDPAALAFTKLKAYHDRRLAWNALRDPGVMARLPPTDMATVREYTEAYYLRKAGKDLYDIAFLDAHHHALAPALAIRDQFGMQDWISPNGIEVEPLLLDFARGLAREDDETLAWLEAL